MDKNIPSEPTGINIHDAEAHAHLISLINNAPGFVYSIDRSFRLVTVNSLFKATIKQHFGIELKEGDSPLKPLETISPGDIQEWKEIYTKAFTGQKLDFTKEFNIIQKSFWAFSICPIFQGSEIVGVACYVRDITDIKLAEIKLNESESRYHSVSESSLLGIVWGNAKGKLVNANQAFCDIMEGTLEQLVNKYPSEFTHPDDLPSAKAIFLKLKNGEINKYRFEKRYITLKGNIKWVEMNIASVKSEEGEVQQIVAVLQDISEKKSMQQALSKSEANLRYLLDNSNSAFLLTNSNLEVLAFNRIANEWAIFEMGVTIKEGELFSNYFPEKYRAIALPILQNVLLGKAHSYEIKYTKRDKQVCWYDVRVTPISNTPNQNIGLCVVANDITKGKKSESEIKSLNELLEKKVQERTAALEEANKELEAFTYSVSHDLLSPLRNIDSFIDIVIEDYKSILNEEGQYTLSIIKKNSTLMGRLIEDLLNFARFGRVPLHKQLVNMNGVVNEVIDELRFMTNKLDAKINLHDMNPAYCDPGLIKQVWVNLISNAIKYSKGKAEPVIEIGSEIIEDQIIYFIKDNGVGFDMKYADKLFGVFHRLHKVGEFEGTGVGLAIVHRIITKHGGKIWADSKPEEGTIFKFII